MNFLKSLFTSQSEEQQQPQSLTKPRPANQFQQQTKQQAPKPQQQKINSNVKQQENIKSEELKQNTAKIDINQEITQLDSHLAQLDQKTNANKAMPINNATNKQDELELLEITQNCFSNIQNILQMKLLEKTEEELNNKIMWLLNNVSTHPRYIQELQDTHSSLLRLEIEIDKNFPSDLQNVNSIPIKQKMLKERVHMMRLKLDKATQEILDKIEAIKLEVSVNHVRQLFQVDHIRYLKTVTSNVQKHFKSVNQEQSKKKQAVLQVVNVKKDQKLGGEMQQIYRCLELIIPKYKDMKELKGDVNGYQIKVKFRSAEESKLAIDIVNIIVQNDQSDVIIDIGKLGEKKGKLTNLQKVSQTLLKEIKQMMNLINLENEIDSKFDRKHQELDTLDNYLVEEADNHMSLPFKEENLHKRFNK